MNRAVYSLGQMQANCYFLTEGSSCLIIDPADSADFLLEQIQIRNLEVVGMIATHGHFDHVMAAGEIQAALKSVYHTTIPLYIDKQDHFLIKRLGETAAHFLGHEPFVMKPQIMQPLPSGSFKVGPFSFEVIKTPGHTPGSSCLYFKNDSQLFTGDTLFKDTIGRYDFAYCDKNKLKESVRLLLQLPQETEYFPGHGESSFIQDAVRVDFIENFIR